MGAAEKKRETVEMPAERPILFKGEMVRAILAGQKAQTRRLVNVTSNDGRHTIGEDWRFVSSRDTAMGLRDYEKGEWCWQHRTDIRRVLTERCPYGQVGDRLWVRETFASFADNGRRSKPTDATYVVFADGAQRYHDGQDYPPAPAYAPGAFDHIKWRPSIHMPRWASRIMLEVTEVRVERLQDISDDDARAEGVQPFGEAYRGCSLDQPITCGDGRPSFRAGDRPYAASFAVLWDTINGDRVLWGSNPWVFAVGFKRIEVPHA